MTTRRTMITGLLAAGTGLAAAGRVRAQASLALRISTSVPPSDFLAKALDSFKSDVDRSGAGLQVSVHPASTLFRPGSEVQALQRGNLEMSTMTTFEVAQQVPELGFFNRAYLFRDYAHLRRVFDGPLGGEYRRTVADKMGIEILATHYLGTRQLDLRRKKRVQVPADLSDLKLRMPSGPEWLALGRTLGVSPVPIGMPEVYLALKTGTIDGLESPLSILSAAKLYEVSEQISLTSHMVQPVFINIASPVWAKLSPAQKQLLETAAGKAAREGDDSRLADEAGIVESLKGRGLSVAPVDLEAFRASADAAYANSDLARQWDTAFLRRVEAA